MIVFNAGQDEKKTYVEQEEARRMARDFLYVQTAARVAASAIWPESQNVVQKLLCSPFFVLNTYHISANSFCENYSFLNLEIVEKFK